MEIFTPLEAPFELSLFFRGNLILRYLFKFIYTLSAIWSLATWANDEQSPRHPRLILSNGFTSFLRGIVGRGRPSAYITYHPLPFDLSPAFPSFPLFSPLISHPVDVDADCVQMIAIWQQSLYNTIHPENPSTHLPIYHPPLGKPHFFPELSLRLFVIVIIIMLRWWRWQSWWWCRLFFPFFLGPSQYIGYIIWINMTWLVA